jgi:hypothetical protein
MVRLCLFCQSKDHAGRDCVKMLFKKGCCYTCGFPHKAYGKDIHGDVRTAECENGLRDILKGGCWWLYRSERWLQSWFERCGMDWKEEVDFKHWIETKEEEGEILNGVRVILEAWREIVV